MPHSVRLLLCFFLLASGLLSRSETSAQSKAPDPVQVQSQAQEQNQAQEQSSQTSGRTVAAFPRHWSFGGSLGLSFWNDGTDILIAPKAFYHWSPMFLTGFGITYIYSDFDDKFFGYHQNSFGGSVMAAVRPIPQFQASVEYEGLQTARRGLIDEDYWVNGLYLGASYISGRVSFGLRYDVLYDSGRSAYGSAWSPVIGFYF